MEIVRWMLCYDTPTRSTIPFYLTKSIYALRLPKAQKLLAGMTHAGKSGTLWNEQAALLMPAWELSPHRCQLLKLHAK